MIYNHRAHNADNEIICTTGLVRVYQGEHMVIWEKVTIHTPIQDKKRIKIAK